MTTIINNDPTIFLPMNNIINVPYNTTTLYTTSPAVSLMSSVTSSMFDYDTGLNSNPHAQKETTKYLMYRILDKWIYSRRMSQLLKYLKIVNNVVQPIETDSDYKKNKLSNETSRSVEKKIDFIHDNILGLDDMRKILKKIMRDTGYKWYDLPHIENEIINVVEATIGKKLKMMVGNKQMNKK